MKVLVVVDMQNDFITGPLGTPEAQAIVPKVCELIDGDEYDFILFTKDSHGEDYLETHEGKWLPVPHCLNNTDGAKFIPEIAHISMHTNFHVVKKSTFGTLDLFHKTCISHMKDMNAIEKIDICGVCTDICVISNALMLRSLIPETNIRVIASACAGTTLEMHQKALDVMKSCHIEVVE